MNRLILPLIILSVSACANEDYDKVYALSDTAPSLSAEAIADMQHMGPTLVDGGLNVAVYSENAERIELLLFDDPEADLPTRTCVIVRAPADTLAISAKGTFTAGHHIVVTTAPGLTIVRFTNRTHSTI